MNLPAHWWLGQRHLSTAIAQHLSCRFRKTLSQDTSLAAAQAESLECVWSLPELGVEETILGDRHHVRCRSPCWLDKPVRFNTLLLPWGQPWGHLPPSTRSQNCTKKSRPEGILWRPSSSAPCSEQSQLHSHIRLCQASSSQAPKISKDGDYATPLHKPCRCVSTALDHSIQKWHYL